MTKVKPKQTLCGKCKKPKGKSKGSCNCWRPSKFTDKEILQEKIEWYFKWCDNHIEETPNLFYDEHLAKYNEDMILYELAWWDSQFEEGLMEENNHRKKKYKKIVSKPNEPSKLFRKQVSSPYTVTWLAIWLWTTRETLMDYESKDEFSDTIKKAKLKCENYAEKQLHIKQSPTWPIFALKNFGWKDKTEVVQHNINVELTPEQQKIINDRLLLED